MADNSTPSSHQRWAHFRFAIVAPLLAAPPPQGQVRRQLLELANKEWQHPITGKPVLFSFSTIERWFHKAKKHADPVSILRRKVRQDSGRNKALTIMAKESLIRQYHAHSGWSFQLHYDNLAALFRSGELQGTPPSYATIRRFMKAAGFVKRHRFAKGDTEAVKRAKQRLEQREVRSYEVEQVNSLWHLDFHHGSRQISLPNGTWVTPMLLGIIDDHSRLICHAQWYLAETAENLIHGLNQAFQKRGLPRAIMSDNGAAMMATETRQGLVRLGILHETTLPYSPYQNGKQEVFWTQVEGRLIPMLEGMRDLDLTLLNDATQAWIEKGYHRSVHSEIRQTPMERFLTGDDLGRPSPDGPTLKDAFTIQETRVLRRSDGTISISGIRFEIPVRYQLIQRPTVRYARWDLTRVLLTNPKDDVVLSPLYPQDKHGNADGQRKHRTETSVNPTPEPGETGMAPL